MTHRPIIFNAAMVHALMEGRKTQTRRILKPQPVKNEAGLWQARGPGWNFQLDENGVKRLHPKPPFNIGDLLWVRESWCMAEFYVSFMADCPGDPSGLGWKPSIHMPRWASRLTLRVTDVRLQRLADITEEDAKAEGVEPIGSMEAPDPDFRSYVWSFHELWDSLNKKRGFGWSLNPWVVALSFTVHHCNIEMMAEA